MFVIITGQDRANADIFSESLLTESPKFSDTVKCKGQAPHSCCKGRPLKPDRQNSKGTFAHGYGQLCKRDT